MLIKISSVTLNTNDPDPTINPAQEAEELPEFFPIPSPFSPAWLLHVALAQKAKRKDLALTNHSQNVMQRALISAKEPVLFGSPLFWLLTAGHQAPGTVWEPGT